MVDTALFVGMNGAKNAMNSLRAISNNLANSNTIGFRADYEIIKSMPTNGRAQQTRVYSTTEKSYSSFQQGPIIDTGEELDVAINGSGFIAVQTAEGNEAYTRAGNLRLNKDGVVTTNKGDLVLGSHGVLTIPPATKISIGERGNVTAQLRGHSENQITEFGNIKLVDIPNGQLHKGPDGLFYLADEGSAIMSDTVRLISGALEGSNVDPVKSLAELIDITRQFELHTKLMSSVDDNAKKSNQLLNITE